MIRDRRIIPRTAIGPALRVTKALDPRHTCTRTITLDGTTYRCGPGVRSFDQQHDGIHDAFREHGDSGSVRW